MNILVLGSGGREHAIVWKISQNKNVKKIYCIPGNGGIAAQAECVNISLGDFDALVKFAKEKSVDMTVVGPEAPLVAGVADRFKKEGLKVFGSEARSAMLDRIGSCSANAQANSTLVMSCSSNSFLANNSSEREASMPTTCLYWSASAVIWRPDPVPISRAT